MDSTFMNAMADRLYHQNTAVVRFEFPYMAERRVSGKKRPPNKISELEHDYLTVITQQMSKFDGPVFIGGKSMGGRIASMIGAGGVASDCRDLAERLSGVVCFGYPFHPVGKPEKLRVDHLSGIDLPVAIFQGTRDKLGCREEVEGYTLSPMVNIEWIETGDHDLKPLKKAMLNDEQVFDQVAGSCKAFFALQS